MSWVARLGLAITHPRWALALASDRGRAGRSGSDLLALLGVILVATQLRWLFGALWLGSAIDMGLGTQAALRVLSGALTLDLASLVLAALALWAFGGRRRELGRAFDLACVVVLPLLYVELAASVIDLAGLHVPGAAAIVSGLAYAWAGGLLALAIGPARAGARRNVSTGLRPAPPAEPAGPPPRRFASLIDAVPPPVVLTPAKRAGWLLVALAAVGTVLQISWIAGHGDALRPMRRGDPAPAFTLPSIAERGTAGRPVALAASLGKVTVLDFWATWCGPCLKALPDLDAVARAHPEVAVLSINLDDAAAARALWDARHYQMTLLADDGEVSSRYGVSTIPHVVVIDQTGRVRLVARGGHAQLERAVQEILAEQIRK